PAVRDAMLPFLSGDFGNASSIHTPGPQARAAVETAREQVAALIGAKPQEIVFTSGGTESDNHAIFGCLFPSASSISSASLDHESTPRVITTAIEHEAVLNSCQELERRGVAVTYLPVHRDGVVDLEQLRAAIRPETALITVMHANNVLAVDLLALSAHKFYGPKGVGALFVRAGTKIGPFLFGGHHQRGFRPGTENVPGIVGMGKAAELARLALDADSQRIAVL